MKLDDPRRSAAIRSARVVALIGMILVVPKVHAQGAPFDVLITNARVVDGTGNPDFRADVGIRGNQISAIGNLTGMPARRTIDATGLYLSPGFIDIHSHADAGLISSDLAERRAPNLVSQGITTVTGGADGRNQTWPISAEIAGYRKMGIGLNIFPMVGHGTVRAKVMGDDYQRHATPAEIAKMQALVAEGMKEGAWGLSAGLEYRPGRYSAPEEVVALAKEVAPYVGFYIAHQRSEAQLPSVWEVPSMVRGVPTDGVRALEETIGIAAETGIPVVGSHIKAQGLSSFGRSSIDVQLVDRARSHGLQVYLDQYPYDSYGGGQSLLIPRWAVVDDTTLADDGLDSPKLRKPGILANARANLRRTLADSAKRRKLEQDMAFLIDADGGADRILILDSPDSALDGKFLADVASARHKSAVETVIDFALTGYEKLPEGVYMRNRAMDEPDIERYMQQTYTATSTDAGIDAIKPGEGSRRGLHPRFYGSLPRKIARYVRDKPVISLPAAVRAATGLPAQIVGLPDRGYIREGYKADIVVFNLDSLADRATYLEPRQFSQGIDYVLENGQFTVDRGKLTGALPGVVINRNEVTPRASRILSPVSMVDHAP
jgi:N-acyl-D-amino-acid deacylase